MYTAHCLPPFQLSNSHLAVHHPRNTSQPCRRVPHVPCRTTAGPQTRSSSGHVVTSVQEIPQGATRSTLSNPQAHVSGAAGLGVDEALHCVLQVSLV